MAKDGRGDIVKGGRCGYRRESFVPHASEYDSLLPVREIDPEVIESIFRECTEKSSSSSDSEQDEITNRRTYVSK